MMDWGFCPFKKGLCEESCKLRHGGICGISSASIALSSIETQLVNIRYLIDRICDCDNRTLNVKQVSGTGADLAPSALASEGGFVDDPDEVLPWDAPQDEEPAPASSLLGANE